MGAGEAENFRTSGQDVLSRRDGEKSGRPRFHDIGSESNGGVAGRDLSLHQLDGHSNTREVEHKGGCNYCPPPTVDDIASVQQDEVTQYHIGVLVKDLGMLATAIDV
jgi:hypothetical protein